MEKNPHLAPMHKIITKTAYAQALFFWVDGALTTDSALTPRRAIIKFSQQFGLEHSLDVRSAVTQYNRMKSLYHKQNKVFAL